MAALESAMAWVGGGILSLDVTVSSCELLRSAHCHLIRGHWSTQIFLPGALGGCRCPLDTLCVILCKAGVVVNFMSELDARRAGKTSFLGVSVRVFQSLSLESID